MAKITANQSSLLKKLPVQGSELADDQKVLVSNGKEYKVLSFGEDVDGHVEVTLDYGAGTWYIYKDHWNGLTPDGGSILPVRYFSQRDNYRDSSRTCFSSSCAMLLEFMKPGTLPGAQGDDIYIKRVFSFGDTTDASVQIKALASFGLTASFQQNGSLDTLKKSIDIGVPVPIGILHHGSANAPSGGGHWICVSGYTDDGFICQDPWGELNHIYGEYTSTNGENVLYSNDCISKRWTVDRIDDGWFIKV